MAFGNPLRAHAPRAWFGWRTFFVAQVLAVATGGCVDLHIECATHSDCPSSSRCEQRQCIPEYFAYCDEIRCYNDCGGTEPTRAREGDTCGVASHWQCVDDDVVCVRDGSTSTQ